MAINPCMAINGYQSLHDTDRPMQIGEETLLRLVPHWVSCLLLKVLQLHGIRKSKPMYLQPHLLGLGLLLQFMNHKFKNYSIFCKLAISYYIVTTIMCEDHQEPENSQWKQAYMDNFMTKLVRKHSINIHYYSLTQDMWV